MEKETKTKINMFSLEQTPNILGESSKTVSTDCFTNLNLSVLNKEGHLELVNALRVFLTLEQDVGIDSYDQ